MRTHVRLNRHRMLSVSTEQRVQQIHQNGRRPQAHLYMHSGWSTGGRLSLRSVQRRPNIDAGVGPTAWLSATSSSNIHQLAPAREHSTTHSPLVAGIALPGLCNGRFLAIFALVVLYRLQLLPLTSSPPESGCEAPNGQKPTRLP